MPPHEEHCQDSLSKYGKRFDELHTWMDEPWEVAGKYHRMYRHEPFTTPREARKLFGEYADHACLDHILLDRRESPQRFESWDLRGKPAGICPRCGSTMIWRRARLTGEMYKGCTNYPACKYHERSYKRTPRHLKSGRSNYRKGEDYEGYGYRDESSDEHLRGPDDSHVWHP